MNPRMDARTVSLIAGLLLLSTALALAGCSSPRASGDNASHSSVPGNASTVNASLCEITPSTSRLVAPGTVNLSIRFMVPDYRGSIYVGCDVLRNGTSFVAPPGYFDFNASEPATVASSCSYTKNDTGTAEIAFSVTGGPECALNITIV